jgi:hypothetical protein
LKTVAVLVAIVQSAHVAPLCSQVVPSVCFPSPPPTCLHASSTAGLIASLTRASTALSAPSEMRTPNSSQSRTTVLRRLTW